MTTAEKLAALVDARERIADPARWTQGSYAVDTYGSEIDPLDTHAVCWCATGSLARTMGLNPMAGDHMGDAADWVELCAYICGATEMTPLVDINDGVRTIGGLTGHAAALAMYDSAIARLQSEVTP